ncbi:hypothetical protein EJB05_35393 [Eragrostis curvula]|uniref:Knottin scorpion toxin-like domain-containing protein n=1 Tax=Eragrostis curvula TaxID=38414 RepID=A0A5J9U6R2_9POAL|nr:hypothetical protein EJB05_35393 [Eragrostis curvula]
MNAKQASVCCLLLVLVLDAVPVSNADANCAYRAAYIPFCKEWMCKVQCWGEAKVYGANKVAEHKCMRGGIKGWCSCKFCQ